MKKNFLALGLAAMMLTLPGCVKDTTTELTEGTGKLVKRTFTVKMELPQNEDGSRLTLDGDNAFVWEEGDEITVMGSDGKTYTGYVNLQGMGEGRIDEFVEFDVELEENVTAKYAWRNITYGPISGYTAGFGNVDHATSSKPTASSTTARLGLKYNQMLASENLATLVNQLPMVGTAGEDGTSFYMHNIFAIAELRVKGTGRLWSAHIFSKDIAFRSLYGHVNLTSDTPVWNSYEGIQNNSSLSPIGMATAQGVGGGNGLALQGDQPTSIYFAVPVGIGTTFNTTYVHDAGDLGIILRGDVGTGADFAISKISNKSHRFTRNMITPMVVTFGKPTTGESATDLSGAGDSNCYMVKPTNADTHYKFKAYTHTGANHTGDGYATLPVWHTANCPVTDIWYESVTSTTTDENGDPVTVAEAPYVHFTVKGGTQNGSMIIGMIRGSHAQHWNQDIWHVWVSDAVDQTYGGVTVLDRNIGATYMPKSVADVQAMDGAKAAETCGFYYQWGRQNPFGSPLTLDGSNNNDDDIYGWERGKNIANGNTNQIIYKSMPWSASGTTAYPNSSKGIAAYKDHMLATMCCTAAENAYQWAIDLASPISGNESAWLHGAKGPQDPCPQGYRVATHDELLKIFRYPTGSHMKYRHWDTVNKKWIYAGKYESAELTEGTEDSYAQHEYGGYHQSAATNNEFVWVAYSGIRYGNAAGLTSVSNDCGALRWAGFDEDARYTNHSNYDDKGGRFFIWGVPSVANMTENADLRFWGSPSHTTDKRSTYTTNEKMPFAPAMTMRNGGNVYDDNFALAFNNALPVRCVKMAAN